LALSACVSIAQDDSPAVVVDPSADTRAELVRIIGEALGQSDVLLANDALTRESSLFIDRKPARDAAGQRLSGRDYGRPERFDLVKQNNECVLVHVSTQKRYKLAGVRCESSR
jgi:hypothetical protein